MIHIIVIHLNCMKVHELRMSNIENHLYIEKNKTTLF